MLRGHLTRTRLGIVLAVAAGVVLGAVFGQPGSSRAATAAVPKNTTAPTIGGTGLVGALLVATHGTWSGKPTKFDYQWSQCDTTGGACLAIAGATGKSYRVRAVDVGHTLRVTVTARNASGGADASSTPTAVVPPSGCPTGTGVIPITSVSLPARLVISSATISPAVKRSTRMIHLHLEITACDGRPVQGASVYAAAIPFNQFTVTQGTTGATGAVTLTQTRQAGFPASTHQRLLTVFARAWKQGEPETAGVSSSRVVAFRFGRS
jgi:hypothetical protein